MLVRTLARAACGLGLIVAALVATGCSGDKPTGTVSGTVKYKGSPLATGEVNFISKTGVAASAKIDASGQYKVTGDLETGEYKVFVTPLRQEPQAPGAKATAPAKFELPAKFREPSTSGTTATVKSGPNDIQIEFKD